MRILCFVLILCAIEAYRCEITGFVFALEIALLMRMCILSNAIFLRDGFTLTIIYAPKNWFSLD